MDSSSSSAPDDDSDKDAKIFEPSNGKFIMNADVDNTTDRRLLLGIIHRDNNLDPRRKMTSTIAGYTNLVEMHSVDSRMKSSALLDKDGRNIDVKAALTLRAGGSRGNQIAPVSGGETLRKINETVDLNQNKQEF